MSDVTQILQKVNAGDAAATDRLLSLLYDDLRRAAQRQLNDEKPGQTLQATALVHEAYVRLIGSGEQQWNSRGHFFAAAAQAMRRILVERARRKLASKRGGDRGRADIELDHLAGRGHDKKVLALDQAPVGVNNWLDEYEKTLARIAENPEQFPVAPESVDLTLEVRQAILKTRYGLPFRIAFLERKNEIVILSVRGPGQSDIT